MKENVLRLVTNPPVKDKKRLRASAFVIVFFLCTFLIPFSFCIWYWYVVYLSTTVSSWQNMTCEYFDILNTYKFSLVNHLWLILREYNRKAGQSQMFTKENTVKNSGKISSTTVFSPLLKKTKLYLTLRLSYSLYELICLTITWKCMLRQ